MTIQIISNDTETVDGRKYQTIVMASEKNEIAVLVVTGLSSSYINVIVRNAAHKAWRGAGRYFDTIQQAVSAYKSADIKSMLEQVEWAMNMEAADAQ